MHRSGTSALAGALGLCGLAPAKDLIAASPSNEKGFWESAAIKAVNDAVLAELGVSWHGLDRIGADTLAGERFAALGRRAAKCLKAEFPAKSDIVLKDPRFCRTLPFWEPIFDRSAETSAYCLIVRHPAEVAESLAARNDLPLQHGLLLWARYMVDAELRTRGKKRVVITFDQLLDDWRQTLARVTKELDLPIDIKKADKAALDDYLTPELRHHQKTGTSGLAGDKLRHVSRAFRIFSALANGSDKPADMAELDSIRDDLDRMAGPVSDILEGFRLERKRFTTTRAQLGETGAQLTKATESAQKLDGLQSTLAEQSKSLESIEQRFKESAEKAAAEREKFAGERKAVEDALAASTRSIAELTERYKAAFADARNRIEELREQRAKLLARGEALQVEKAKIAAESAANAKAAKEQVSKLEAALAEAEKRREREKADLIASHQSAAKAAEENAARLERALDLAAKKHSDLVASHQSAAKAAEEKHADLVASHQSAAKGAQENAARLERAIEQAALKQAEERAEILAAHQAAVRKTDRQIARLETALAATAQRHADERAEILAGHEKAAKSADRQIRRLQGDLAKAIDRHQSEVAELEQKLEATAAELAGTAKARDAAEEELGRVKHKYRAAQFDVDRERKAHATTQSQLVAAENSLARYQNSALWKFYLKLCRAGHALTDFAGRLNGAARRRRREQMQAILASGLFDGDWYLKTNPDVAGAGLNPLVHFYDLGWREGRDPGPQFVTSAYLKVHADVARSGVNPLLHYIEFGQSEGRTVRTVTSSAPGPAVATIEHNFPEPAPVFRAELPDQPPTRWQRSYRLSAEEPGAFLAGKTVVGLVGDRKSRTSFERAFSALGGLSGFGATDCALDQAGGEKCPGLADAWHVNTSLLRTRWKNGEAPVVVRAFQFRPADGEVAMVAEGLVENDLDPVDVSLADPWFPVLFVFGHPDGKLIGTRLMAFPSLCRGGLHYPELLAVSPEHPDPVAVGIAQAAQLLNARKKSTRLIKSLCVDVEGADGTSPLFDPGFRKWVEKVADVTVSAAEGASGPAADLLVGHPVDRRAGSGKLLLAWDMVPTLSALSLVEGSGETAESAVFLPILIAGAESSQPATLVEVPLTGPSAMAESLCGSAASWPRLSPAKKVRLPIVTGPAVIRVPRTRELADAELLSPTMEPALSLPEGEPVQVTWMLFPSEWRPEELIQSLQALALQAGAENHRIVMVGETRTDVLTLAASLFADRAKAIPAADSLAANLSTPLVGYLGPGVLLQDGRTAEVLAHLLRDPAVASAASALVSAERRGKTWHVSVADAGSMPAHAENDVADASKVAHLLWRSAFPVAQPPRDFWLARASAVRKWLANPPPQRLAKSSHICTTVVTASYIGARSDGAPEVRVPPVPVDCALKARTLFG